MTNWTRGRTGRKAVYAVIALGLLLITVAAVRYVIALRRPAGHNPLANTPRYAGLKTVAGPIEVFWPGLPPGSYSFDEVGHLGWGFYQSGDPKEQVAAFYRQEMVKSPYAWSESRWIEEPEGSLGIFYHMGNFCWLSLWFIDPEPPATGSNVVALWETSSGPLAAPELGTCGE